MSQFDEWETFKNFRWWEKIVALVAGAPLIGLAIIFAPFWIPVLLWGWWLSRKDRENPASWAKDKQPRERG